MQRTLIFLITLHLVHSGRNNL